MKLDSKTIAKLTELRATISSLKKKEEKLTSKIKSKMEIKKLEEYAPVDSPHKLVLSIADRTSVTWKNEWRKVAKKVFGKKWKKKEASICNSNKVPVTSLCIEINEEYKK